MKLPNRYLGCAVASLLMLSTANVLADDDTGWFIGVSANRVSADFEDSNDVDFDDSDTAFGVRAGYMFTDVVGVELGYLDLGDFSADGDRPGNRIDVDADAFSVALVLNWAVHDQVDLYGKLGAYHIDANSDSVAAGVRLEEGDSETEAFYAVGAELDLGQFNVFTEFSQVDTDVNDLAFDIISLGVKFEFQ